MFSIYKYSIAPGINKIKVPHGSKPLSVGEQLQGLVIWFEVRTDMPLTEIIVFSAYTGEILPNEYARRYIGTVQQEIGLVSHVYTN